MSNHGARLALKKRLGRTWTAFFERHGNFTAIQLAAIPVLLEGKNAMICAPTASGKTQAAIVPLIERHCIADESNLRILYLTPTRALVNDLLGRLSFPLETSGISLAVKTRDMNTFDPKNPSSILITTPESFDSLLTSRTRLFANLRAVVIDELHLFDRTVRGDQLRVLLRRLNQIREYGVSQGDARDAQVQYVALSATLPDPEQTVRHYFDDAQVIRVDGKQALKIDMMPIAKDSVVELLDYLDTFRSKNWRKALIFCNSRSEVESYAVAIRHRSPFGEAVYVHYSNIAPERRLETEEHFASDSVALCLATNTLELGIDVGNIDVVILLGPPGSSQSFAQRIGRGNRRQRIQYVACFYRTPLERLIFDAFAALQLETMLNLSDSFRLSVLIQQIFSLIKQSPTGALRLNTLSQLFEGLIEIADLEQILGHLQTINYLKVGRPSEWQAASRLDDLFDQQAQTYCDLSIYGNIQGTRPIEIRDQHTHQVIASVETQWLSQPVLTLEGRAINVEWIDGEAIWVTSYRGQDKAEKLHYRGSRKQLSFELARLLPAQLGLEAHIAAWIEHSNGWYLFHCLGDLYGHALMNLLSGHISIQKTKSSGLYLLLKDNPQTIIWTIWTVQQIQAYIEKNYRSLEPLLDLGAFHFFLPIPLRRRVVLEQFNVLKFVEIVNNLRLSPVHDNLNDRLADLIRNT